MDRSIKKKLARYVGNFGTGFFGPLIGVNTADQLFQVGLSFPEIFIMAVIASALQIGMMISVDAVKFGNDK